MKSIHPYSRFFLPALLIFLFSENGFGVDKIIFQDGESIEGQFVSQDASTVTFSTNGISFQISRAEIQTILLDTKTDKFLLAAKQTTDPERKKTYLKKSLDQGGRSPEARYEVFCLLLGTGELAAVEARTKSILSNKNLIDDHALLVTAYVHLQRALYPEAEAALSRVNPRDLSQGAWLDYQLVRSWIQARHGDRQGALAGVRLAEKMNKEKVKESFAFFFPGDDYKNFRKKLESNRTEDKSGASFVESFYNAEALQQNSGIFKNYLYREQKLYRDRNIRLVITAASAGAVVLGILAGSLWKAAAEGTYTVYNTTADTTTATALGDGFEAEYALADAFFLLAESCLVVTAVFGTWTLIDHINYVGLTTKRKRTVLALKPTLDPIKQQYGMNVSLRF